MYISMNWISDFVDLSGVDLKELIGRFTLATAEVEDIYVIRWGWKPISIWSPPLCPLRISAGWMMGIICLWTAFLR